MERSLRNEEGFMVATRKIIFVTRSDATKAKGLKSKQEVLFLSDQGGLTLEESNIVFHIPFTTWKDSQR
jgi:hypothetical protein